MRSFSLALLALAACDGGYGRPPGSGHTNPSNSSNPDLSTGLSAPEDGSIDDGCSASAKLIYTIDSSGMLASFQPNQTDIKLSAFHDIGGLSCRSQFDGSPFSMAIDRNATAWVEYVAIDSTFGDFVGGELF